MPFHFHDIIIWGQLPLFKDSSSQFGSVDTEWACEPKDPGFNSGQGHVPRLQAPPLPRPWLGLMQKATSQCVSLTSMFLSVFPALFHCLYKSMGKYPRVRIKKIILSNHRQRCKLTIPLLHPPLANQSDMQINHQKDGG
uniref:Uncharacterized protein n=1 Tax=Myotis myotis TaxID=51298 RepID=A0A7J7V3W5_MYOMY|nr:hypothetical protein mMyoMyo1_008470 [Myotis myotis]